ncbi:unnamed protein product [Cylindrotheca closterium]|uniref:Uncharacterized protein n=1 Tax=Cylindrotheca closterium TaxID=2856 RepID=A0AAD2CCW5_9STRA|nr:unnamed protein product [Cylindrotheca closterium]
MSPLGQFMKQLLQNHTGEVQIINDNARITTERNSASLQLKNSLHSSSLPSSSNHSTTRWDMDGSNHSTEVGNSTSTLNQTSSVPTAPIRKPSNDPPQGDQVRPYESLDISSHKAEKRVHKYLGNNSWSLRLSRPSVSSTSNLDVIFSPSNQRKSWDASKNCHNTMNDIFTLVEPTTAPNTPEPSPTPSRSNTSISLNLIKPSRKLSPKREEEESPIPPPSALELNRSLSKTLLGADDLNPQAPKIPTRRPSHQPDLNSPTSQTSAKSSSADAYSRLVSDIPLCPLVDDDDDVPPTITSASQKNSNLVQQAQAMAVTLPSELPLIKKSKRAVFAKPSNKWLGSLGKRN